MRVHFVNTGPKFPYAYYLGIVSAVKAFGSKVKLWLVERPDSQYLDVLTNIVEIEDFRYEVPDFPTLHGRSAHFRRVVIFDNSIWRILAERGGTIMGLDSFTLRPFHDLLAPDKEMLVGLDDPEGVESASGWPFCMHGATCRPGSGIAQSIYEASTRALFGECPSGKWKAVENGRLKFGGAGIIPFMNATLENLDEISVAEYGLLGGYHRGDPLPEFYVWKDDGQLLRSDCRTIPLYATSRRKVFDGITEESIDTGKSLLASLVKETLTSAEWSPGLERKYTFHLLGLVHLPVNERYTACAFTQKIVKMSKMLLSLGHQVFLYGAEGSDAPCTEFIQTHTLRDIRQEWGRGDNRFEIGYDWKRDGFKHDFNAPRTKTTQKYYDSCIEAIERRKEKDDFLLVMQGVYQKPIAEAVKLFLTCEPGIGYRGSYARFKAFESAYLQNFTYGSRHPGQSINGHFYDRVIPNYFDAKDFPFCAEKDDYFLYVGRMIERKGVRIAIKTVEAIGGKLILAGQGTLNINSLCCEFVGYIGPEERAELMGKAKAVFVPTLYLEAFGGVNVEAQLCGTPVLTTSYGAFPETVEDGLTGFLCNTLDDFVWAAKNVHRLNPAVIRKHAERFLMENVRWEFERWFDDLHDVYESALDEKVKGWHRIRVLEPGWRTKGKNAST